jgi:hypothetical protein
LAIAQGLSQRERAEDETNPCVGFDHFYGFVGGDTSQWQPNLFNDTKAILRRVEDLWCATMRNAGDRNAGSMSLIFLTHSGVG